MVNTQLKILRVFGPTGAEVSSVLRGIRDDGCPGLRLLERDGEFAICVQVSAPNRAMAEQYCDKWAARLRAKFGDDVFAEGETSLAQATLDALLDKRKLLVAVDETTGRLLGALLQPLAHSEAVFDFGTESYADPQKARRIAVPEQLLKRFPGDVVQAAAGRALAALQVTGADYAAAYMPASVGQCPFVLVCDRRGAVACALPPDMNDTFIGNQILDLLRRRLFGLQLTDSCITFRPGHDRPLLVVSEAAKSRGNTVRFSLRRRTPPTRDADHTADFEPMLDFDSPAPFAPPKIDPPAPAAPETPNPQHRTLRRHDAAPTPPPAPEVPEVQEPTGVIRFEDDAAAPAAQTPDTPADIQTMGAEGARHARIRRARPVTPAAEPAPEPPQEFNRPIEAPVPPETRSPARSVLDDDIPDFSADLDPAAIAAAQAADDAAEAAGKSATVEDFTRAATQLFDTSAVEEAAQEKTRKKRKKNAAPPEELPPAQPAAASIKNRSLEIIEKSERRRRRTVTLILVILVLAVLVGGGALWLFFRNDLGARPAAKSYGTALYDSTAESYLTKALERRPGVVGYLGWPGFDGALVYSADTPTPETPESGKSAEPTSIVRFATPSALDAATPGNTVLECTGDDYKTLADADTLKENGGFTLYTAAKTYRFKTIAVYYLDPDEQGEGAFDLYNSTDLSDYYDYLTFVAGVQARSLFDTGVDVGDNSRFLTVTTHSEESGTLLCVTGRLIEDGEAEILNTSAFVAADEPLLTAAQYQSKGQPMPTVRSLVQASVEHYAQQSAAAQAARKNDSTTGDTAADAADLAQRAEDLQAVTDSLIASTDKMLAGLTDVAGSTTAAEADLNKGAEGSLPEQTVTVDQMKVTATAAPTATPEPTATPAPAESTADGEPTPEPTATPEPTEAPAADNGGGSSAEGETINVTMNGTAQTMDLVRCLAMVAQNELGPNAPAEAYKAQCVATHCWIISQSGYPSVLGAEPGAAALAAAQEVAHVLVTYNGQVCFTPYFASASTGTASSAEVWGGDRAWLQAVDSPYDQQVSSNWNTNGNSSGTARFARETLENRIRDELGIDLSGVDPNTWFTIKSANQYGWVAKIQVGPDGNSETVSGRWFRESLLARQSVDGRSLRSQCFTVSYNADLDCFIFDVYGYGHGCGMSQWGAIGYARNGWGYRDILTHYFTGTTITTY
ncbi:SpoIID/LytB domain-containing protein [Gemmiger sp.]